MTTFSKYYDLNYYISQLLSIKIPRMLPSPPYIVKSYENAVYERLYRPEGPYLGNVTADVLDINFVTPQYLSNYFIQDGSYFRMDYMTLSYLFGNMANSDLSLGLSLTVNNAFVITKYKGLDPEIYGGIDNRIYPRPRVYAMGVNLTF